MTLNELIDAIEALPLDDLRRLREHIEQRERETVVHSLDRALSQLREGLTGADLDRLEWAMNAETVQEVDPSAWQE